MNTITINQLQNITNETIIDIRDNYSYNIGHIPGAINIPGTILKNIPEKYLSKEKTYYIYCSIGTQSANLTNILNSQGYNCYSIQGGYQEYKLTHMY